MVAGAPNRKRSSTTPKSAAPVGNVTSKDQRLQSPIGSNDSSKTAPAPKLSVTEPSSMNSQISNKEELAQSSNKEECEEERYVLPTMSLQSPDVPYILRSMLDLGAPDGPLERKVNGLLNYRGSRSFAHNPMQQRIPNREDRAHLLRAAWRHYLILYVTSSSLSTPNLVTVSSELRYVGNLHGMVVTNTIKELERFRQLVAIWLGCTKQLKFRTWMNEMQFSVWSNTRDSIYTYNGPRNGADIADLSNEDFFTVDNTAGDQAVEQDRIRSFDSLNKAQGNAAAAQRIGKHDLVLVVFNYKDTLAKENTISYSVRRLIRLGTVYNVETATETCDLEQIAGSRKRAHSLDKQGMLSDADE